MDIDKKAKGKYVNQRSRRAWTPEKVDRLIERLYGILFEVNMLVRSSDRLVKVIQKALAPSEPAIHDEGGKLAGEEEEPPEAGE